MAKNSENLDIIYDDIVIDVSNLGTKDCSTFASKIDASRLQGFRVMKTEYWASFEAKTAGEGPLMFGFSMNHTASEIEEAIEADPQSKPSDANHDSKRPIWPLDMIHADQENNEGRAMKGSFNPRWSCPEGHAALWWVYNMDAVAMTTGTLVHVFAKHFGVWLRD